MKRLLLTATVFGVWSLPAFAQTQTITFDGPSHGAVVTEVTTAEGFGPIQVMGRNNICERDYTDVEAAVIFDSSLRILGELDLGTPNVDFGGPGVDNDGDPNTGGNAGSPFQNDTAQGNLLIVHDDCQELLDMAANGGELAEPNDTGGPSVVTLVFPEPVTVYSFVMIDKERQDPLAVQLLSDTDSVLAEFEGPQTGDNGKAVVATDAGAAGAGTAGVTKILFERRGERGIDDIVIAAPEFFTGCTNCPVADGRVGDDDRSSDDDSSDDDRSSDDESSDDDRSSDDKSSDDKSSDDKSSDDKSSDDKSSDDDSSDDDSSDDGKKKKNRKNKSASEAGGVSLTRLPGDIALATNYPNPVREQATIEFLIPETTTARLAVYDVVGRQVALLFDGTAAAGQHTATFDSGDLPNGMYVYRLEVGQRAFAKTLLVVR